MAWVENRYFHTKTMRTSEMLDVKLRLCPKPKNKECPAILHIPKNSEVLVYQDIEHYDQADGHQATWRKIKYMQHKGWVNENLLQK